MYTKISTVHQTCIRKGASSKTGAFRFHKKLQHLVASREIIFRRLSQLQQQQRFPGLLMEEHPGGYTFAKRSKESSSSSSAAAAASDGRVRRRISRKGSGAEPELSAL